MDLGLWRLSQQDQKNHDFFGILMHPLLSEKFSAALFATVCKESPYIPQFLASILRTDFADQLHSYRDLVHPRYISELVQPDLLSQLDAKIFSIPTFHQIQKLFMNTHDPIYLADMLFIDFEQTMKIQETLLPTINLMKSHVLDQPCKTDRRAIVDCTLLIDTEFKMEYMLRLLADEKYGSPISDPQSYKNLLKQLVGKNLIIPGKGKSDVTWTSEHGQSTKMYANEFTGWCHG